MAISTHATDATDASGDSGQTGKKPERDAASAAVPPQKSGGNEEPAFALEPDLPSDGRDEEGEAMIRALPQQAASPETPNKPVRPDPADPRPGRETMATNPNVPPPEPVEPLSTPPEPGEVQTTPMPMSVAVGGLVPGTRGETELAQPPHGN